MDFLMENNMDFTRCFLISIAIAFLPVSLSFSAEPLGHLKSTDEYINSVFKLPKKEYFRKTPKGHLAQKITSLTGVGSFAIVSELTPLQMQHAGIESEVIRFRVCQEDMTAFDVYLYHPPSYNAGSSIIKGCTRTMAKLHNLHKSFFPSIDKDHPHRYRLIRKGQSPDVYFWNLQQGFIVHASIMPPNGTLDPPYNPDVVFSQMNLFVNDMAAFLEAESSPEIKGKAKKYYAQIKKLHNQTNRRRITTSPATAEKFELILKNVPPEKAAAKKPEKKDSNKITESEKVNKLLSTLTTPKKIIAGQPYIIARKDGQPIPLVKIADPKKVRARIPDKLVLPEKPADVQFYCEYYVKTSLRSDGLYQIIFPQAGERNVKLFYLDKNGKVYAAGGLNVDVQLDPKAKKETINRKLKG